MLRELLLLPAACCLLPAAVTTNKGTRPPEPKRQGFATTTARGPSFQQLSHIAGIGNVATSTGESFAPFSGSDAEELKKRYGHYGMSAQGCIARALAEDQIKSALNPSVGTAPELVVLGDALLKGMQLGRTLFFQAKTFRDPVFNPSGRVFNVDILKRPHADSWLEPVDGQFFHMATLEQEIHDADRNKELEQYGHVLPISDLVCQTREDLQAFLSSRGSP